MKRVYSIDTSVKTLVQILKIGTVNEKVGGDLMMNKLLI